MKLTDTEREELRSIFNNKIIAQLIIGAHLNLFIANPVDDQKTADIILKKINTVYTVGKTLKISANLRPKLKMVICQTLQQFREKQDLFIAEMKLKFLKFYYSKLKKNDTGYLFQKFLIDFIYENIKLINPKSVEYSSENDKDVYTTRISNELHEAIKTTHALFTRQNYSYFLYKDISFISILVCLGIAILDYIADSDSKISMSSKIVNILIAFISAYFYFHFSKITVLQQVDDLIKSFKSSPDLYKIYEFEFIDLDNINNNVELKKNVVYTPIDLHASDYSLMYAAEAKRLKPKMSGKSSTGSTEQKIQSKNSIFTITKILNTQPICYFPGNVIYCTKNNDLIASNNKYIRQEIREGLPKDAGKFFFFNKTIIKQQLELPEKSVNTNKHSDNYQIYLRYKHRWDSARVVAAHGESGIKKLSPPYRKKLSDGKYHYFKYELKTVNTLDRCLGEEVYTEYSPEGKAHTLVDFFYHMPRGPGK